MNSSENSPLSIVDEIERVRRLNNVNWMNLVRIAIQHAPQSTKLVLKKIEDNDREVNRLCRLLQESIPD